jgi:uncharacterized OB-fold protein
MNCNTCGAAVQPAATFCDQCGRAGTRSLGLL